MSYVNVNVEVDVDEVLDDLTDDELIAVLNSRGNSSFKPIGATPEQTKELLEIIYQKRRNGKSYDEELDILIYNVLGRLA